MGAGEVRERISEARPHIINAAGNLHQSGFRMELEAISEEREVRPSTDHRGRVSSADRRGAGDKKLIVMRLNAKVSSHQRPTLKRLERFERLERLEPVDS